MGPCWKSFKLKSLVFGDSNLETRNVFTSPNVPGTLEILKMRKSPRTPKIHKLLRIASIPKIAKTPRSHKTRKTSPRKTSQRPLALLWTRMDATLAS